MPAASPCAITPRPVLLVTGAAGQVGREIVRAPAAAGFSLVAFDRIGLDITNREIVHRAVAHIRPAVIINAAAYTAVDRAESEPEAAFAINRDGPAYLAEACAAQGAALLHISTDYVFDGAKTSPWIEEDPVAPLNIYGLSKAAGEAAIRERLEQHLTVRTSWVYGALGGGNFVKTMLRLGGERDRLTVVADQHGCPTAAADLAAVLLTLAERLTRDLAVPWGIVHAAGQGETTWHGFARAIFAGAAARGARTPAEVVAIPSVSYPTPAQRPTNSVLACARLQQQFGITLPPWTRSLHHVLDELVGPVR